MTAAITTKALSPMNERDDDESLAPEDGEHSNTAGFGARSEDGPSSSNTTSGGDSSSEEDEVIAESEDRAVIRIRLIVFGVLFLATVSSPQIRDESQPFVVNE